MRTGSRAVAVCAAMLAHTAVARAQVQTVTLSEVQARAREQALQVVSATFGVDEVRGRLLGATPRFQSNPEIELQIGTRSGPEDRFTDYEIGVAQAFEPGSRRTARIAGANAAIAQSEALVDEARREALRFATAAFFRALHAQEQVRLLTAGEELALSIRAAADRRFEAGDIATLDVNIARASLARIRAQREGADAVRALAIGDLRQLLQLDGDLRVEGELRQTRDMDLSALLESIGERPDLRALEAGVQEADAERQAGQTYGRPDYEIGVSYGREEADHVLLGGVTLTLPTFARGQELQSAGLARGARLRAELAAARTRIDVEVRSTFEAYSRRLAAIDALEADAIPGIDDNERLAARSFEVGQIGLPDLLLLRREILDTRSQYLDALLEAALTRVDLETSAGLLR